MATIVDAAEMANAVYSLTPRVVVHGQTTCSVNDSVWHSKLPVDVSATGFKATVYRTASKQLIIAFAGTDDMKDALIDDAAITLGTMPPQAISAVSIAKHFAGKSNALVTGHSLGGALAVIAAAQANLPAVTFNAPGMADSCVVAAPLLSSGGLAGFISMVGRCAAGPKIRNIRIDGDPVSSFFTTGRQSGRTTTYPSQCRAFDMLCKHGMATCLAAVRADSSNYVDII